MQVVFVDGTREDFMDLLTRAVRHANTNAQRRIVTTKEAAKILKVTPKTVIERVNAGLLTPLRRGSGRSQHLFFEDELIGK